MACRGGGRSEETADVTPAHIVSSGNGDLLADPNFCLGDDAGE